MAEIYPFKECEQYINLLQENITRMANNSANCKNWLVAIIAGSLAVAFSKENAEFAPQILYFLKWVTGLFFFLDCLYLGIERDFIRKEKVFISSCKAHNLNVEDVKKLFMSFSSSLDIEEKTPDECTIKFRELWKQLKGAFCAMWSWSTTPFYGIIMFVLFKIG